MNPKVRKVFHVIIDVFVILILLVSALVLVSVISSRASGGVPNLFGRSPIGVQTNSMHGENADSFDEGDLIICEVASNSTADTFKEGDVITFLQDISGNGVQSLVTHRIYKVNEDGSFFTKGDNNDTYDQDPHNSVVFPSIRYYDVLAVYHGTRIPVIGKFINLLNTSVGFFWIVLFPMILFFLYQAVRVIMNAMAYSKEKGAEQARLAVEQSGLTKEQKAQAIAEYLASQNAAGADRQPVAEQPVDEQQPADEVQPEGNESVGEGVE